jgi:hypothetical protein
MTIIDWLEFADNPISSAILYGIPLNNTSKNFYVTFSDS